MNASLKKQTAKHKQITHHIFFEIDLNRMIFFFFRWTAPYSEKSGDKGQFSGGGGG
jgi:hypothetical protein